VVQLTLVGKARIEDVEDQRASELGSIHCAHPCLD
jgi:hypothetical protein